MAAKKKNSCAVKLGRLGGKATAAKRSASKSKAKPKAKRKPAAKRYRPAKQADLF